MNKSMIAYILGWILKLEGLFMLIPTGNIMESGS